jgi:hypothetical protein
MGLWQVPDAAALGLIEYPGKLGSDGKRPRFRFTSRQQRISSYLPEIDTALSAAGLGHAWLHRKIRGAPFVRRSPIEHMIAGGTDAIADVLRHINRIAMREALARHVR